ncbi:MAG: Ig-like domain-containing protein, partial [Candidatus Eisenbacteria bacterium]|nr:Ig-like domain-containing protein [Candidatus Eisenbacteria bacterium]
MPIRVRFTDATGKPQEGVAARFKFALPAGSGALDGDWIVDEVQITDVNGEAQVQWSLPATLGPHTLVVTGLGLVGPSVMFTATTVTNDADIIPTVVQFGPTDGQSGFSPSTAVFASFNQKMNTATLPNFMHLTAGGTQNVAGKFSFQDDGRMAIFQPTANLPFGATCTLLVDAGATDTDGQTMAQSLHSTFTIEAPPSLALSSIDPPSASSGATVVLSGQGFSISPATNVVTFNGVLAPVRQASLTSLTTLVPINTSTGPVVVNVGAN